MPCAAIGPGSLFGLVTFSHKIGLYDVQGPIPVVKHIMIPADMDGRIPVDLEMAMPLSSFLAPVSCTYLCILFLDGHLHSQMLYPMYPM
jgi:hypothetical protein